MRTFIKSIANLLFSSLLLVFMIIFLLKISYSKLSDNKEDWMNSIADTSKNKSLLIQSWFSQAITYQRSLFVSTEMPSLGAVYQEITQKISQKKDKTRES